MNQKQELTSWGHYFKTNSVVQEIKWACEEFTFDSDARYLVTGLKRSYGDCCLNDQGIVISAEDFNRFISFDDMTGVLHCQSGVSLEQILDFAVPKGWFLPVSPGTKFVTVGGAIANDVHGKNHHTSGTFGENVIELELLRSDGKKLICNRAVNTEMFTATIAGLGLTGLILSAKIKLKSVKSAYMNCKNIFFYSLEEFLDVSARNSEQYEYTVAWMDCASKSSLFGRGIFMCANHSDEIAESGYRKKTINLPVYFPNGLLNNLIVSGFNRTYFSVKERSAREFTAHYDPYFYPLDAVGSWNKVYGRRGFFQFQCVVPATSDKVVFLDLFKILKNSDYSSYLTVVKEFSERPPAGLMSFPRKGITVCFDIPNRGSDTLDFIKKLNNYVCENGGAIYPAKDAGMSRDNFISSFGNLNEFYKFIDPKFSSDFWRRTGSR